jgi:hypothetical protein
MQNGENKVKNTADSHAETKIKLRDIEIVRSVINYVKTSFVCSTVTPGR